MQTDAGNTVKDAQMMEARLQSLLGAAAPENRYRWAKEEKSQGRKVIGTVSPYVPEEMIYAAGMIPLRLWGSNQAALVKASAHRPPFTNSYHTRLLESLLSGELDFLDGLVATDADDSLKRMWDVWVSTKRTKFNYIIHVPNTDSNTAKGYFALSLRTFLSSLESFADVRVGSEALIESVNLHNLLRSLMRRVYELRKQRKITLSGAESLAMTTAALVMPKDLYSRELGALLPYLKIRKLKLGVAGPRILVSSDDLDDPAYVRIIEEGGCVVAMDDLDTGSRYCWCDVSSETPDPVQALATYYLTRPQTPRMLEWKRQVEVIIEACHEFQIDGVIELPILYDYPREWRVPYFAAELSQAGIPNLTIRRDYLLTNDAQMRTRTHAFIEMLSGRAK